MNFPTNNASALFRGQSPGEQPRQGISEGAAIEAIIDRAIKGGKLRDHVPDDEILLEKTKRCRKPNESIKGLGARSGISPLQVLLWDEAHIESFVAEAVRRSRDEENFV